MTVWTRLERTKVVSSTLCSNDSIEDLDENIIFFYYKTIIRPVLETAKYILFIFPLWGGIQFVIHTYQMSHIYIKQPE